LIPLLSAGTEPGWANSGDWSRETAGPTWAVTKTVWLGWIRFKPSWTGSYFKQRSLIGFVWIRRSLVKLVEGPGVYFVYKSLNI
jgi:hypothetical protein